LVIIFSFLNLYRLGFAAESFPRFIIPTEINNNDKNITQNLFIYKTLTELYDNVVNFFQKLFFKYILVSPKDRKIVIVESVLCPTDIRETFAKVLFKHFEVCLDDLPFILIFLIYFLIGFIYIFRTDTFSSAYNISS